MGRSTQGRRRRAEKLRARIASGADDHFPKCTIMGCGRPTQRAAKSGLGGTLCRKHVLHRQRHGSPWCPSPSAVALRPYVKAAAYWIKQHQSHPFIIGALSGLSELMASAGPVIIATRLRGLSPDQRAKVAVARLRDAGVKPERLLAIAVAVSALICEAPAACHRVHDWRICAIAKAVHRLKSGTHLRWTDNGGKLLSESHTYPRASGHVLLHLGSLIEKEAELITEQFLAAIVELKVSRFGAHPSIADPLRFATKAARVTRS